MTSSALIRPAWTPLTIAMMVLGFIIWWPLGLAMLAYILWGDKMGAAVDDTVAEAKRAFRDVRTQASPTSGNAAFDEYRRAELKRLEEERRKLEVERREFEDYVRSLRMARDKEEFDRFMAERQKNRKAGTATSDTAVADEAGSA